MNYDTSNISAYNFQKSDSLNITKAFTNFYHTKKLTPFQSLETTHENRTAVIVLIVITSMVTVATAAMIVLYIVYWKKLRLFSTMNSDTSYKYRTLPYFQPDNRQPCRTRHGSL